MSEQIMVSVITVCFNSTKTIRKAVESVLNQTYRNIEYIIIDGKSTDNTIDILQEYKPRFKSRGMQLRIVSEKDNGIYDAMNKGIRLASGQLVGQINSDDWYEVDAVETAVREYEKEKYDYFYADIRLIREDGSTLIKKSKMDRIATSRHWNHPSTFVTKDTYEKCGLYRCEGIHDDFDLFLRMRKANKKIHVCNKVLANFCVGGVSNAKSLKKCVKRCIDRFRCYRNNGYSPMYLIECIGIECAKFIIR